MSMQRHAKTMGTETSKEIPEHAGKVPQQETTYGKKLKQDNVSTQRLDRSDLVDGHEHKFDGRPTTYLPKGYTLQK